MGVGCPCEIHQHCLSPPHPELFNSSCVVTYLRSPYVSALRETKCNTPMLIFLTYEIEMATKPEFVSISCLESKQNKFFPNHGWHQHRG